MALDYAHLCKGEHQAPRLFCENIVLLVYLGKAVNASAVGLEVLVCCEGYRVSVANCQKNRRFDVNEGLPNALPRLASRAPTGLCSGLIVTVRALTQWVLSCSIGFADASGQAARL